MPFQVLVVFLRKRVFTILTLRTLLFVFVLFFACLFILVKILYYKFEVCLGWPKYLFLLFQLEVQSWCIFIPNDSLPSPSTIVSGDIPGTVRSWYHGQTSMPGTLVFCLPQIRIISAGHKYMEPLQEIPFVIPRPILEEGTFKKILHTFINLYWYF